jgi:stage III sporulation protein AE
MKRVCILALLLIVFLNMEVFASETDSLQEFYDEADLSEAEEIAQEAGISFKELIHRIYTQDTNGLSLLDSVVQALSDGIADNYEALRQVFLLSILGAMLQALSQVFGNRQIGTMGFYVCYLCMMGFLMAAFQQAETIAQNMLTLLLEFMRALLPAYYLGLVMTLGSANGFYGIVLTALSLIEEVMKNLLIPGIRLYLILMLLNDLQEEDHLSKMAELVKTVLDWSMKTIFAGVIGLQLVQSLISPYTSAVSQNLLVRAASSIPGIGNSIGAVSSVVLGSSMLIRNTVGVAAIIVVVLLCGVPIVQLVVIALLYQAESAVIQPFAEKRMVSCVAAVTAAVKLLLKVVMLSALMLIITLAILCAIRPA